MEKTRSKDWLTKVLPPVTLQPALKSINIRDRVQDMEEELAVPL
jgi:hypothetical protein